MFRTPIRSTKFSSSAADVMFGNITGGVYQGDVSFLSTVRALISSRMPKEESIHIMFTSSDVSDDDIDSREDMEGLITGVMDLGQKGVYSIHSLQSDKDTNGKVIEKIDQYFTQVYPSYSKCEKITVFFQKSFPVTCYLSEELKSVAFFVDYLDMRKLHYIQMALFPTLPWYYNRDEGVTPEEKALVYSLKEKTETAYLDCLETFAQKYDFRGPQIKSLLRGFETKFIRLERENAASRVRTIEEQITSYNEMIGNLLRERGETLIKILGIDQKLQGDNPDESEIMEYFLCNKKLFLESVSDSSMVFTVTAPFTYFDKDMAERVMKNKNGYVYVRGSGRRRENIDPDRMVKLLKAVFLDEKLKILTCAAYQFDLSSNVVALGHHEFPSECSGRFIPNPHINEYRCLGDYSRTLNELVMKNNYIGALEQCIASCKSLNWGDSTVMDTFMNQLYKVDSPYRCVELPDGSVVTPLEAIEWLEKQESEGADEEKKEEA